MESPAPAAVKPRIFLLFGDDTHAMETFVREMIARMGDPGLAEMNTTRLDGKSASDGDLRTAVGSLPFLCERRLVILTNPLARAQGQEGRERLKALLDYVPPETALVLLVEDQPYRSDWDTLRADHWLRKWVQAAGPKALERVCALPSAADMPGWIQKEVRKQGGNFTPDAARALAAAIETNTELAAQEIAKLLTYADGRTVEAADVDLLCAPVGQGNIFDLVDAAAEGRTAAALRELHTLLEFQDAAMVFGMLVRQYRLLIQARVVADEGGGAAQIGKRLNQKDFVSNKLARQVRRYSLDDLREIYRRLLQLDEDSKSGQGDLITGLDTFVAGLSLTA
ncbi:MAG: DNA polymerase III subunit delta [Chloroflexi bacterium]|nr:DNA polymerase III subunit delta [Chloroflexota bacterium]